MKKALSVLLTAVLLLGLAAPAAFAAPAYAGTDPQQTLKVGEEATLTPAHSCPGPVKDPRRDTFLMYWDVEDTLSAFYVNFRPETYVDTNLLKGIWQADSSTLGNGALTVEAVAAGEVTVYVECQDCGWAWAYPFVIEEAEKPIVDPEPNNLCKILRIWWTDLKWTWDYEIHPFFKFVFYSVDDWFHSAWNMLCDWIKGLFEGEAAVAEPVTEPTTAAPAPELEIVA